MLHNELFYFPLTASTRNAILQTRPALANPAFMRLFLQIHFGKRCEERGAVMLDLQTLVIISGSVEEHRSKEFVGSEFLNAYRDEVDPEFSYTEAVKDRSWSRTVSTTGLQELADEIDLRKYLQEATEPLVLADTGKPYSAKSLRNLREEFVRATEPVLSQQEKFPALVNSAISNRLYLRTVRKNKQAALDSLTNESPLRRNLIASTLEFVSNTSPVYTSVDGSSRAYAIAGHIQTLNRAQRRLLLKGLIQLDWSSVQAAIASVTWGAGELQVFLADGRSLWTHLADFYGVPLTESFKDVMKPAFYALVFGGSVSRIKSLITLAGGWKIPPEYRRNKAVAGTGVRNFDPDRFFDSPLVQDIYSARERKMQSLIDAGAHVIDGKTYTVTEANVKSELAREVQHVETEMMTPLYNEIVSNPKVYTGVAHLHDGVVLSTRSNVRRDNDIKRIVSVAENFAASLNIPSRIEWEVL